MPRVFAPGSWHPVQQTLREGFARVDPEVEVQFHSPNYSGLLAKQNLSGAQADVFISAGWRYILEVHDAGLLPQPEPIAGNELALLVRPEMASWITGVPDLARRGVRVFIPIQESDPLGEYIAEIIAIAGLDEAMSEKRTRGKICEHLPALREGMANADIDGSVTAAARALHVSRPTLSNLINGPAGISPEMAVRLSKAVCSTPGFWMRLQTNDDLAQIERRADTIEVSPLVKAHMAQESIEGLFATQTALHWLDSR